LPISIALTVGARVVATDLVTVIVVSNSLVIGIDGTGTKQWLTGPNAKRENGLWNSHVANLIADVDPYAMTYYSYGPSDGPRGEDSDDIALNVLKQTEEIIRDAGGGTRVALVGWSRGAMIALSVANELSQPAQGKEWTVEFVGLYDPVDMSSSIGDDAAVIHDGIRRVVIVGPKLLQEEFYNVDYPVGLPSYWLGFVLEPDPVFVRMSRGRITSNGRTSVDYKVYNASHGGIGGCPGYNGQLVDAPDGSYGYDLDRQNSIRSDKDIRNGMRVAGLDFVPDRNEDWYGIPKIRPVIVK
jgi:pimeloyl-ACP methyl ester carboxylesterase